MNLRKRMFEVYSGAEGVSYNGESSWFGRTDWMGKTVTRDNVMTFHHIIEQRNYKQGISAPTTQNNGALLSTESHRELNSIEFYDPDLYRAYRALFYAINKRNQPPEKEDMVIARFLHVILEQDLKELDVIRSRKNKGTDWLGIKTAYHNSERPYYLNIPGKEMSEIPIMLCDVSYKKLCLIEKYAPTLYEFALSVFMEAMKYEIKGQKFDNKMYHSFKRLNEMINQTILKLDIPKEEELSTDLFASPISASNPLVLTNPDLTVDSLEDFIILRKRNPEFFEAYKGLTEIARRYQEHNVKAKNKVEYDYIAKELRILLDRLKNELELEKQLIVEEGKDYLGYDLTPDRVNVAYLSVSYDIPSGKEESELHKCEPLTEVSLLSKEALEKLEVIEITNPSLYNQIILYCRKIKAGEPLSYNDKQVGILLRESLDYEYAKYANADETTLIQNNELEDWIGYKITYHNPVLSYSINRSGEYAADNTALLTRKAIQNLQLLREVNLPLYEEYHYWFKVINEMNCPVTFEIRQIMRRLKERMEVSLQEYGYKKAVQKSNKKHYKQMKKNY